MTEKLHGTNARIGSIAGTTRGGHTACNASVPPDPQTSPPRYWFPATLEPVIALLNALKEHHRQVILFGEVYGSRIQKLDYGQKRGVSFAAFDLYVDGKYLEYDAFTALCGTCRHDCARTRPWPILPGLRQAPEPWADHPARHAYPRGVVVKLAGERYDVKVGRVVFKYLNDDYLLNTRLAEADATDL